MFKYIFGSLQVISLDEMKSAPASLKTELAMYLQALGELPEHGLMKMLDTDKSGVIVAVYSTRERVRGRQARLYRRRILQLKPHVKALAEIYTIRIFLQISWNHVWLKKYMKRSIEKMTSGRSPISK